MGGIKRGNVSVAAKLAFAALAAGALAWAVLIGTAAVAAEPADQIKVYKTPGCGCCTAWEDYLREEGFEVVSRDINQHELNAIKQEQGLGRELASCHTAFIGDYVIEGHVPADDIRRLIDERPDVDGIAVPGMPVGSPGMEMGDRRDPYDVVTFVDGRKMDVFASYHQ